MKKQLLCIVVGILITSLLQKAKGQDPITTVIKEGVTKVIRAVDLKIQRLQTKNIWLQNAQKIIENTMSKPELDEISDWLEKQRVIYNEYFEELQKVKSVISYYHSIKEITQLQLALVKHYKQCFEAIKKDSHFTGDEVKYVGTVYSGIINESIRNIDGLFLVINSFTTQMPDEKRMEIIEEVKEALQKNYEDLKSFSTENIQLSMARAKDQNEIFVVKELYGIQ